MGRNCGPDLSLSPCHTHSQTRDLERYITALSLSFCIYETGMWQMIAAQWGSEVIMLIMNELMLIILIIKLFKNVLICTTILQLQYDYYSHLQMKKLRLWEVWYNNQEIDKLGLIQLELGVKLRSTQDQVCSTWTWHPKDETRRPVPCTRSDIFLNNAFVELCGSNAGHQLSCSIQEYIGYR